MSSRIKQVKVKVTIDLELPFDVGDPVYKFDAKGLIIQTIFDGLVNYANVKHLQDALQWLAKSKENKKSTEYMIYKNHHDWAKILQAAKTEYTIEST